MKHIKTYTLSALLAISAMQLTAQTPMSLYYMETIPQSNQLNPAMAPRANFYIALPSLRFGFQNGLAFEDVMQKDVNNKLASIHESIKTNTEKHNEFLKELGLPPI